MIFKKKFKDEKILNWVIDFWESEKDFLIEWDLDNVFDKLDPIRRSIITLDQSYHPFKKRCTSMSTLSIIYSYLGEQPSKKELLDFNDYCIEEYNRWTDVGNYVKNWVEIAVKFIKKIKNKEMIFFRWTYNHPNTQKLLKLWYGWVMSYRWNREYQKDRDDDTIVQGKEFNDYTYWHAIAHWHQNRSYVFNDTYPWRGDSNRYQVQYLQHLINQWTFRPSIYFIIPQWKIEEFNKDMIILKKALNIADWGTRLANHYIEKNKERLNENTVDKTIKANNNASRYNKILIDEI